jgi:hypothetical protein
MVAKNPSGSSVAEVFRVCSKAVHDGKLIRRESRHDKEFHFQNWIRARLVETKYHFEMGGRNSYPDFRMVSPTDGYEVKGLAYPGRVVNYDCNSQPPTGNHNGRTIYYIFGRYPSEPDGNIYPVLDLVICHGDFLNADHEYIHKNRSVKGFGSYGDIMIRDRKMYVAPTPFGLVSGVAHNQTLILPAEIQLPNSFKEVGTLARRETERLIIGYAFDLRRNVLAPQTIRNPSTGRQHVFKAWRLSRASDDMVIMDERSKTGLTGRSDGLAD